MYTDSLIVQIIFIFEYFERDNQSIIFYALYSMMWQVKISHDR